MTKYRQATVSGMFYPDSCDEIKHYITHFNAQMPTLELDVKPRALIVPHAGYIYSGYTANLAYHYAASKRPDIERVIVIGPSHRVSISGASIALFEAYHTPCGEIAMDLSFCHTLQKKYPFLDFVPSAHEEHSTEVQMPFIHHYFKHAKVVEIVYGDILPQELSHLISDVLQETHTLVVISTDLSHFYTEEKANKLDHLCIKAITELDTHGLSRGCEACGIVGVKAMVECAIKNDYTAHFLDYRTSFARTQDASRVVGYASFILG